MTRMRTNTNATRLFTTIHQISHHSTDFQERCRICVIRHNWASLDNKWQQSLIAWNSIRIITYSMGSARDLDWCRVGGTREHRYDSFAYKLFVVSATIQKLCVFINGLISLSLTTNSTVNISFEMIRKSVTNQKNVFQHFSSHGRRESILKLPLFTWNDILRWHIWTCT